MQRLPILVLAGLFAALTALPAAPASANGALKAGGAQLTFSPQAPDVGSPIVVRWTADRGLLRRNYALTLATAAGSGCLRGTGLDLRLAPRRRAARVTLKPGAESWCPGQATLTLRAGSGRAAPVIAVRAVVIAPKAKIAQPLSLKLLDGSALSVHAADGRPDRSASLSGSLTGTITSKQVPKADVKAQLYSGSLSVDGLAADPLCSVLTPPRLTPYPGSAVLIGAGNIVTLTLVLGVDAAKVAGCDGNSGFTFVAPAPITFTGRANAGGGLLRLPLAATQAVTYSGGATATLGFSLLAEIKLG